MVFTQLLSKQHFDFCLIAENDIMFVSSNTNPIEENCLKLIVFKNSDYKPQSWHIKSDDFLFMLATFTSVDLFLVLRRSGLVLATWSFLIAMSANALALLGAVYAINAALIAGNGAFDIIGDGAQRLMLTSLQVTSDFTSFHLSLVLSSAAYADTFIWFWRSTFITRLISGWGIFASLLVVVAVVGRDFIPLLSPEMITAAFMMPNLVALLALGLYLGILGVKIQVP